MAKGTRNDCGRAKGRKPGSNPTIKVAFKTWGVVITPDAHPDVRIHLRMDDPIVKEITQYRAPLSWSDVKYQHAGISAKGYRVAPTLRISKAKAMTTSLARYLFQQGNDLVLDVGERVYKINGDLFDYRIENLVAK